MPSIYLSPDRYAALRSKAEARGWTIKRGPGSELGKFIESLVEFAPVTEYNRIFDGLKQVGLVIASDRFDTGNTWHYRWNKCSAVRGFSTPEAALIAAVQDMRRVRR